MRPRTARLIKIDAILQTGRYVNAKSLVPVLGVKEKTARRDLHHMINTLKLPMAYCYKNKGFRYTAKVTYFSGRLVAESELHLLALLRLFLGTLKGTTLQKKIERLIRDITANLPGKFAQTEEEWSRIVSVHNTFQAKCDPKAFDILSQAAAACMTIKPKYRKAGEKEYKERAMDPVHIRFVNADPYLFARDHGRGQVLRFSVARMRDIETTGAVFDRPDFDIEKETQKSLGIQSADGDYHIVIRLTAYAADVARERDFPGLTGMIDRPDGRVDMHLNLSSLVEIRRWIGEWLPHVSYVSPPELKQMVMEDAQMFLCAMRREES